SQTPNHHIAGLLHLLADLEEDQVNARPPRNEIGQLWHNPFTRTLDPTGELAQSLHTILDLAGATNVAMPCAMDAFYGPQEGNRLPPLAQKLKVATNRNFTDDLILL